MIVKSDVRNDARVRREATALVDAGHRVTVLGERRPRVGEPLEGVTIHWTIEDAADRAQDDRAAAARSRAPGWVRWLGLPTRRRRAVRAFEASVRRLARDVPPPDVVHAHDLSALAVGAELATAHGARLVYDAHECWTGRRLEGRPEPLRRVLDRRLERVHGARADAVITVSPGIAAWFGSTYGWDEVAVVRNTFPASTTPLPPLPTAPTGVVYAGRIDAKRDLLTAVEALAGHDLVLEAVGPADAVHLEVVRAAGGQVGPSLPLDEVDALYRTRGLALVPLSDDQLNHRLALPNKVFHAVRAGVPVIAADLPELHRLVDEHGIGELYTPGDSASLRAAVERAVERYATLLAAVEAAADALSWSHDEQVLLDVYRALGA